MDELFSHLPHVQLLICIVVWVLLFAHEGHRFCTHKLIRIMLFFNIVIFNQCLHHSQSVINSAIVLYITVSEQKQQKTFKKLLMVWLLIFEPLLLTVCILHYFIKDTKDNETISRIYLIKIGLKLMMLLAISLLSLVYLVQSKYFIAHFAPNSGTMWILSSHLFQRYLFLFQAILFTLPFICIFPLTLIKCAGSTKIAIQWFICIFVIPNTTLIHIWGLFALESRIYSSILDKLCKDKQVIWNTLTIMATVISLCSYCFYERMISIWTNSHLISVGYYFIQVLLFWGVHAIYLSEALIIEDKSIQKPHRSLITKIKEYFLVRIKEM